MLVTALVALATSVMHDANHGSFSTHRTINRVLAYTADVLGTSSWLWRFQHNVLHHGNTNMDGLDSDIDSRPGRAWLPPSRGGAGSAGSTSTSGRCTGSLH